MNDVRLRARNLSIVCLDNGSGDINESSASVSDGIDRKRFECRVSNGIAIAAELPEALRVVNIYVMNGSSVFR